MIRASFRNSLTFQDSSRGRFPSSGWLERQSAVCAGGKEGRSVITLGRVGLTVARLAPYTETEHKEVDPLAL